MDGKNFPTWAKIIVAVVLIIIGFFSIRKQKKEAVTLQERGRYIIGETKGWVHNHRSSDFAVDYFYTVMGTTYKSFILTPRITGIKSSGGKYLVIFDPKNPKDSKMLFDKPVAYTTLINYPDTGWIAIPEFVVLAIDTAIKNK
jgi:hypothetical protein